MSPLPSESAFGCVFLSIQLKAWFRLPSLSALSWPPCSWLCFCLDTSAAEWAATSSFHLSQHAYPEGPELDCLREQLGVEALWCHCSVVVWLRPGHSEKVWWVYSHHVYTSVWRRELPYCSSMASHALFCSKCTRSL